MFKHTINDDTGLKWSKPFKLFREEDANDWRVGIGSDETLEKFIAELKRSFTKSRIYYDNY